MRVYKFLDAQFGMKSLREKRLKISTIDDLNDLFELLPFGMADKTVRMALNMARKTWGTTHGMMCFSARWRDPVIWAHYSDKHRGLCLGFDIPDDRATTVKYVSDRLLLPDKLELSHATSWTCTKYTNWSYEQEVRCYTTLQDKSDGLYFMEFGQLLSLAEVIAGARCKLTENEIRDALQPLKDIKLLKARSGFQRFEVVEDQRGFRE
jgi:hypothetical protein